MKIQATLIKCESGVILLDVNGFTPELEVNKKYNIQFKEYRTSRSIEQNNKMWAIIQQIALFTGNDEMDIYIKGLEKANAKAAFIAALPETENSLRKNFRAIKPMGTMMSPKGVELITYKVYEGSSKFDTAEMKVLIDYFINLAGEYGIETEE